MTRIVETLLESIEARGIKIVDSDEFDAAKREGCRQIAENPPTIRFGRCVEVRWKN